MILFLDIDGVLHPFFPRADLPDEENQHFSYLPRLESVIREFPELQVVIASDWRNDHSLDELRGYFTADIRPRIVGVTPRLERGAGDWAGCREREAMAYIATNHETSTPWLALDDDEPNWLPNSPLVLCNDGFRDTEEKALRALIADVLISIVPVRGNAREPSYVRLMDIPPAWRQQFELDHTGSACPVPHGEVGQCYFAHDWRYWVQCRVWPSYKPRIRAHN